MKMIADNVLLQLRLEHELKKFNRNVENFINSLRCDEAKKISLHFINQLEVICNNIKRRELRLAEEDKEIEKLINKTTKIVETAIRSRKGLGRIAGLFEIYARLYDTIFKKTESIHYIAKGKYGFFRKPTIEAQAVMNMFRNCAGNLRKLDSDLEVLTRNPNAYITNFPNSDFGSPPNAGSRRHVA